ncbi:MAG: MFS transporter [Dehalococcoidia bacterium]|nr:MFS transporter [Dehalococcoidia bacterium]
MTASPDPAATSDDPAQRRPERAPRLATFAALYEPRYPFLFAGLVLSFLSLNMQNLARGYLAYQITGSGAAIGLVLVAWGVPMMFCSFVAGVVADRFPKRNIMLMTQSTLGVSAFLTSLLVYVNVIELWHLIVIGFLQGVAFGFNVPTRQAIVPEIVRKERLTNAVALTNAGSSVASVAGPPLAGVIIAVPALGIQGAMLISSLVYLLVLLMLLQLPASKPVARATRSFRADFLAGWRYVRRSPVLPLLLLMGYVPWIVGQPYQQVLPAFAGAVFPAGSTPFSDSIALGIIMGAVGVGALAGSLMVATLASMPDKYRLQIVCGVVFGVSLFLAGLNTNFWLAVVLFFLTGGAATAYQALNQGAVLEATDKAYFGRVLSVSSLVGSMGPVATLPYGVAVDVFGAQGAFAGSATIILIFLATVAVLRPKLQRAPDPATDSAESAVRT